MDNTHRLGFLSSVGLVLVGATYAVVVGFGIVQAGLNEPIIDPTLAVMDFTTLEWPSTLYAVELLAWDVYLGLALVLAAPVFTGSGRRARARRALAVTGVLCLLGGIGLIVGNML
ncbi:MAG: hypothetical protein GVY14_04610 [Spirochaetes bacterium]|jgi:hypothetical protein|nr:hypothetical protein [Spirochaetota bacterium]